MSGIYGLGNLNVTQIAMNGVKNADGEIRDGYLSKDTVFDVDGKKIKFKAGTAIELIRPDNYAKGYLIGYLAEDTILPFQGKNILFKSGRKIGFTKDNSSNKWNLFFGYLAKDTVFKIGKIDFKFKAGHYVYSDVNGKSFRSGYLAENTTVDFKDKKITYMTNTSVYFMGDSDDMDIIGYSTDDKEVNNTDADKVNSKDKQIKITGLNSVQKYCNMARKGKWLHLIEEFNLLKEIYDAANNKIITQDKLDDLYRKLTGNIEAKNIPEKFFIETFNEKINKERMKFLF